MNRLIFKKLTAGFAIALIAVIVNALISYRNTNQLIQNEERVVHTLQVLAELESALSTLKDAEIGQQGYILTGDAAYLQPYQAAIASIDEQLASLRQLTADNPEQQRRLAVLEQQATDRLEQLQRTITLRHTQGLELAQPLLPSGQDRQMMDKIRQLIIEMKDAEVALLERRVNESQISIQRTTITFTLASLFGAGLLTFLYFQIRHDITARQQAAEVLQERENHLQAILNAEPECVKIVAADGTLLQMNPAGLAMIEAPGAESVLGQSIYSLVVPEHRAAFQALNESVCQGNSGSLEFEIINCRGHRRWLETSAVPLPTKAGGTFVQLAVTRDITQRKQAEALLKQTKNDLEFRVAERTAELVRVNQQIQQELDERRQIQSALELSQARFAGILEIASDAIISVDSSQAITLFNQGAEKIFGYKAEEVVGQPLDLLLPNRSAALHRQHVSSFARSDSGARRMGDRSEIFGRRQDGSEFPAEASISRLQLGNETVFTAILRDISDRKQAEASLRISEERLQLALEGSEDGLWDWNIPTGECYLSPGWVRMLGYEPGEMPQHISFWERLIHPDDCDRVMAILDAHLQDNSVPYKFDYRLSTKRGNWKWIANYGKVTGRDANGVPVRMTGTHRDVSDRKQTEFALSQLAAIIESSGDAIDSSTLDGTIISWNASAERLYGYTSKEAIGRSITFLIPFDRLEEKNYIYQTIRRGEQIQHYETVRQRKDGTLIDVALTVSPVKDTTGKIVAVSAISRDITDQLQIDRMKSEFISVVSHELRTPLTSIHGSLGMLASGLLKADSDQGKRMLQIAVDSTDRLVRLINDILDIERIESDRVKMEKVLCAVDDLLTEAVNVVQPLADRVGVTLSVTSLPIQVWADLDRIVQTLTNLLSNAIKFSPSGSTVSLTAEKWESGRVKAWESEEFQPPIHPSTHPLTPSILFTVKDHGCGIPPDKLNSIFERFQQVDSSDSRNHEGTGLGLAICRSIVQQHDGQIWVKSVLGEGSAFSFTLPLSVNPATEPLMQSNDAIASDDTPA